jgi:hypothetical protein
MIRSLWLAGSLVLLTAAAASAAGPYCGAAGTTGSTAILRTSTAFTEWASGYTNYLVGADCAASWQTPAKALGQATGSTTDICCLGNGGQITLTFDKAIANGTGFDFAVFENSFNDTFLELAYVEVSSDGANFFRFSNHSLTASPVAAFGSVDPTNIDGLGGKYRVGYGTPFDLDELAGVSSLLDVNAVAYVRIVDVVGDGTCLDSSGKAIYDPTPTTGSGGFDLEAVGVINTVPEPGTCTLLLGAILAGCRFLWRKRRISNDPV